jgi:hypothetical protein
MRRRCGFVAAATDAAAGIVWARGRVSTDRCPVSEITAESWGLLESYWVWRRLGASYPEDLGAREVEAFLILDHEARAEESDGGR